MALAGSKDWDGLEEFAREKKSPVGYEPFIVASRAEGAPDHVIAGSAPVLLSAASSPFCFEIFSFFQAPPRNMVACSTVSLYPMNSLKTKSIKFRKKKNTYAVCM